MNWRPHFYILDPDGVPVPVDDAIVWGKWLANGERQVALDVIAGVRVSTVFLGVDHNWSMRGPPILWETMVFDDVENGGETIRYSSLSEARAGHLAIVKRLQAIALSPEITDILRTWKAER